MVSGLMKALRLHPLDDNCFPMDENKKLKTRDYPFEKTWQGMEKVYDSGKTRAIGVSNFSIKTQVHFRTFFPNAADNFGVTL